jgi:hypothetical protein
MKRRLYNAINRNTLLFTGGLLGVAHETLLQHAERPTLLILFAAMMGLPAFLPSGSAPETEDLKEIEVVKKMDDQSKEEESEQASVKASTESKTK